MKKLQENTCTWEMLPGLGFRKTINLWWSSPDPRWRHVVCPRVLMDLLLKQELCLQVTLKTCPGSWSLLEESRYVSICWEMEEQARGGERWPVSGRVPRRRRRRWAVSGRVQRSRRGMLQFRWTCWCSSSAGRAQVISWGRLGSFTVSLYSICVCFCFSFILGY